MPVISTLGSRIEQAIRESVYNAKEVAARVGITPQAVSKSIHKNSMGRNNLRKLAAVTVVDEEWLIHGRDKPTDQFDSLLMARCIVAVKKAAEEIGMRGLDEEKVTNAALMLYKANL